MNDELLEIIRNLPKPFSAEEQYLYALVCEIAGVKPKEGYLADSKTFKNPFWRMDKYWRAFCLATENRLQLPTVPSAETVSLDSLKAEVSNKLLDENRVTTGMLQQASVTEDKLADSSVATSKLANNSVTTAKLSTAVQGKLLGEQRVTLEMLSQDIQDKLAKIK